MDAPAPSPFLPGTKIQFAVDSTSIGMLKTCPRLYQLTILEGWNPKNESPHLRFGKEYAQALQDYHVSRASGLDHEDSLHDIVRALLERTADWRPDHKLKTRDYLLRTVIWYLDKFEDDPAETVILANGKAAVELTFKFELPFGPETADLFKETPDGGLFRTGSAQPYLLCGHLDRVVNFNGDKYVMDQKTTTSTPGAHYFNQYEPNNQMSLYTIASQVIFGSPIRGVIIDVAQVAVGFSRFIRGFTYRTPDQTEEWLKDLQYWLRLAEGYATAGYWPQNDTACDKFGGCRFREVCSKSPHVREQFLKSSFEKRELWNPLRVR